MKRSKLNETINITRLHYKHLVDDLRHIQKTLDKGQDIDVRLCIDFDECGDASYIIRSGDVSYDQRHSELCGASSINSETVFNSEHDETLEGLINQCLDQVNE